MLCRIASNRTWFYLIRCNATRHAFATYCELDLSDKRSTYCNNSVRWCWCKWINFYKVDEAVEWVSLTFDKQLNIISNIILYRYHAELLAKNYCHPLCNTSFNTEGVGWYWGFLTLPLAESHYVIFKYSQLRQYGHWSNSAIQLYQCITSNYGYKYCPRLMRDLSALL